MPETNSDHTQHVARMHAHRLNVHRAAAQIATEAASTVAEYRNRVGPTPPPRGYLGPNNGDDDND